MKKHNARMQRVYAKRMRRRSVPVAREEYFEMKTKSAAGVEYTHYLKRLVKI